jgi:hypothetical protein
MAHSKRNTYNKTNRQSRNYQFREDIKKATAKVQYYFEDFAWFTPFNDSTNKLKLSAGQNVAAAIEYATKQAAYIKANPNKAYRMTKAA